MNKTKVENMQSSSGKEVANQFIITTSEGVYFQSYKSVIAFIPYQEHGEIKTMLDRDKWDFSTTTGKYRNIFLGENKQETQHKIDEGIYTLTNLN